MFFQVQALLVNQIMCFWVDKGMLLFMLVTLSLIVHKISGTSKRIETQLLLKSYPITIIRFEKNQSDYHPDY